MRLTAILALLSGSAAATDPVASLLGAASAPQAPFALDAQPLVLASASGGTARLRLEGAAGAKVYADSVEVEVVDPGPFVVGEPALPDAGAAEPDPVTGLPRGLYCGPVVIGLPVTTTGATSGTLEVEVRWQGCRGTLCYPQQAERVFVPVTVEGK